jgi:hypothetical protein
MQSKIINMTYDKLDEIFRFVRYSLYQFENMRLHKEDIRILMPESINYMMQNYYGIVTNYQTIVEQLRGGKLYDIEVYPHYKNEIVVYCKKFEIHEELDQPKILVL